MTEFQIGNGAGKVIVVRRHDNGSVNLHIDSVLQGRLVGTTGVALNAYEAKEIANALAPGTVKKLETMVSEDVIDAAHEAVAVLEAAYRDACEGT